MLDHINNFVFILQWKKLQTNDDIILLSDSVNIIVFKKDLTGWFDLLN